MLDALQQMTGPEWALLAWTLAQQGHQVSVFDPAPGPKPAFDGQGAAGFTAAGMLSPLAELDNAEDSGAALKSPDGNPVERVANQIK